MGINKMNDYNKYMLGSVLVFEKNKGGYEPVVINKNKTKLKSINSNEIIFDINNDDSSRDDVVFEEFLLSKGYKLRPMINVLYDKIRLTEEYGIRILNASQKLKALSYLYSNEDTQKFEFFKDHLEKMVVVRAEIIATIAEFNIREQVNNQSSQILENSLYF